MRKIFANNLLQFFQQNYYGGDYYSAMDYVSRIVRDTTVDLSAKASTKLDLSNTYSLDLSRLITDGRKSMYLLEIKGVEPLVPTDEYDYDYYFGDYRTYRERSKLVLPVPGPKEAARYGPTTSRTRPWRKHPPIPKAAPC